MGPLPVSQMQPQPNQVPTRPRIFEQNQDSERNGFMHRGSAGTGGAFGGAARGILSTQGYINNK